jgi:hypothetical protein
MVMQAGALHTQPASEEAMTTGAQASYERAVERARALGGASRVTDLGGDRYTVLGRQGDVYRVRVDADGETFCICPAGQLDNVCWHVMAVTLRRAGLPKLDPRDADSALLARPSGIGVGMVGRWAEEDDRNLLDLFAAPVAAR